MTFLLPTMLSPAQMTALIASHYPTWQVCYLHNNHHPVIGILPKTSWQAFYDANHLYIKKTSRDVGITTYPSDYITWQNELMSHMQNFCQTHDDNHHYYHGLMGFIGYDICANHLNPSITIKQNQPCAYLGHYDIYLSFDDGCRLIGVDVDASYLHAIADKLALLLAQALPTPTPVAFYPSWTKHDYDNAFYQTQEYIKAGDTYQINLTQKWQADMDNLADYLPALQDKINAPFAAFLKLDNFELLSVSPELFFEFNQIDNAIHLIAKPIKGTRPRHDNPIIDDDLKNVLKNSEKDISENLMIVDLLRNDLGKYAKIGTVKTPKRFAIESFKNVHHMVSTITAELKESTHPMTVLFGSLPAGSITGTPKKRACEIIFELEHSPRGAYCGTMGYMNFDGTGIWNVLIRTLQKTNHQVELWAGGGITIKSDMDSEYQECMDKVGGIMGVIERG